jgi:hypothetical protein
LDRGAGTDQPGTGNSEKLKRSGSPDSRGEKIEAESGNTPQNVMLDLWSGIKIYMELQNTPQSQMLNAIGSSPLRGEMNVMRSALHSEGCPVHVPRLLKGHEHWLNSEHRMSNIEC